MFCLWCYMWHVWGFFFFFNLFAHFNVFLWLCFLPWSCSLTSASANVTLVIQKSRKINHLSTLQPNFLQNLKQKLETALRKRIDWIVSPTKAVWISAVVKHQHWLAGLKAAASESGRRFFSSLRSVPSEKCQSTWPWKTSEGYVCIFAVSSELIYGQIRSVSVPENECRTPCDLREEEEIRMMEEQHSKCSIQIKMQNDERSF